MLVIYSARRDYLLAVAIQTIAYSGMIAVMAITPVAMSDIGYSFDKATLAVEMHLVGMFSPSVITSYLIDLVGGSILLLVGFVIMMFGSLLFLANDSVAIFTTSIALVGIGWNWAFVPTSGAAVNMFRGPTKVVAMAFNDTVMLTMVAVVTAFGGLFYSAIVCCHGHRASALFGSNCAH
eukprot:m.101808 g.101808  ORF g.101808 m.101808 type:complete len:179 (-) comp16817_c0_seq9:996-1532(-)